MDNATDTIVISTRGASSKTNPASPESLQCLCAWLEIHVLPGLNVTAEEPIELLPLPRLKRVLAICPTREVGYRVMQEWANEQCYAGNADCEGSGLEDFRFAYAAADSHNATQARLEVPPSARMFLISPPASPLPEFDNDRQEEPPSERTHHAESLARASALQTDEVTSKPAGRELLVDSSVGRILVDRCASHLAGPSVSRVKTAMPPRSIFND